jgi:outer membrane protein assembly factor BamB
VVPANGNELYCFEAKSGKQLWKSTTIGDKFGYSAPTIHGEQVFIGCLGPKGEFRALNLIDGSEAWCAATGQEIYDSSPAVTEKFVAIGSVSGLLSVVDRSSGRSLGSYQCPTGHFLSSPAADGSMIYVATYSDMAMGLEVSGTG